MGKRSRERLARLSKEFDEEQTRFSKEYNDLQTRFLAQLAEANRQRNVAEAEAIRQRNVADEANRQRAITEAERDYWQQKLFDSLVKRFNPEETRSPSMSEETEVGTPGPASTKNVLHFTPHSKLAARVARSAVAGRAAVNRPPGTTHRPNPVVNSPVLDRCKVVVPKRLKRPVDMAPSSDEDEVQADIQYDLASQKTLLGIKLQLKPSAPQLPQNTINKLFKKTGVKSITILPAQLPLPGAIISRPLIGKLYGGNDQRAPWTVNDWMRRHDDGDAAACFAPRFGYEPFLPRSPGAPGLILSLKQVDWPLEFALFVGIRNGKWLYMGHYSAVTARSLTVDEYKAQPSQTKDWWNDQIGKSKSWGVAIRARIRYRKERNAGDPTEEDIIKVIESNSKRKTRVTVSPEDIVSAYSRGEEVVNIICLKPRQYKPKFQETLRKEFVAFLEEQRAAKRANLSVGPTTDEDEEYEEQGSVAESDPDAEDALVKEKAAQRRKRRKTAS